MSAFDKDDKKDNNKEIKTKQVSNNFKAQKSFAFIENDKEEKANNLKELVQKTNQIKSEEYKPLNKKKNIGVWVYLNEEQKKELEAKAKKANLSVSKYIMIKLFGID